MDVRLTESPAEAASNAVAWLAHRLRDAIGRRGEATLAMSGGSTAPELVNALVDQDVPWGSVTVWQVDERVAPDGDDDRNVNALSALPSDVTLKPMPVTCNDLPRAASRYGDSLPERFDIVHLGVGPDGHTASWPPDDPVIDSPQRVGLSGEYEGRVRMTMTPRVVNSARRRLVYVTGTGKATVIADWLNGGHSAPISRVRKSDTVVVLDPDASAGLPK